MDNDLKKKRGQFFTTKNKVLDALISLIKNNGTILEPSAGQGHIVKAIEDKLKREVIAVEIDSNRASAKICNSKVEINNFFTFIKTCGLYDTIIGNPPFVKLKNVEEETINLLPEKIPGNGNLYYFFIEYCASLLNENGELIFIAPKEWLFNVSAQFLRDFLCKNGNFTHFIDCGEEKLFDDADVPALCIFRYVKGYNGLLNYYESLDNFFDKKFVKKKTTYSNTIIFSTQTYETKKVSDFFDIKVGLVTGAEKIFKVDNLNLSEEFIINIIGTNKLFSKYIFADNITNFNELPEDIKNYFLLNKTELINRKIKAFTEKNWWTYGALRNFEVMNSNRKRIYGLTKTRSNEIFWKGNEFEFFSGGIVGLFLKESINIDLNQVAHFMNSKYFKEIMKDSNLYSNNKVSLTPSVLANLPFPF